MKIGISTYELLIPKKVFSSKIDKELEFDSPLPEYCPDIARIVKVDCTPFIENCEVNDGKATVTGKAVYDVLYETDYKNRLRCCNFTQEFNQSIPIPRNESGDISAFCKIVCEKIGCKLLSPRRLIIKSTLNAHFEIEGETAIKALEVNEDKETFFRKKTIGFDGRTMLHENTYRFDDTLSLAQSEKCIGEIVCGNISLQSPQVTLSPGRAEIKTSATVHTLCEEENNEGRYYMSVKTLPVNIEYNNEAIEDYKNISVTLEPFDTEFSPELDQYGESRVIKTAFSVKMCMKINEPKAYTVAEDMFEKDFDSIPVVTSAILPHLASKNETSFSAEAKLAPMMPKPEILLDSSARDYGSVVEMNDEGVTVSGAFTVTLLAETAEGIQSFDHSIPYNQFIPLDFSHEKTSIVADTTPVEVIPTLHSDGSATIRVIATSQVYMYNESEETFISEVTKRTASQKREDDSMLIYFFPQKDEDLWSIAKHYRVNPESVIFANPNRFDGMGSLLESEKPILIKI
ncbi:MAG: DUF3794 domain-containing protein [Clostridia bacterium]|nr:DUF3794 domain-containing protein [Clostridia bacterium]